MRQFINILILLSCIIFSIFANAQAIVVIDAGSSGTRLHVFHTTQNSISEGIPAIKTHPGLSSFVTGTASINKTGLDENLKMLITTAKHQDANITHYPIYVYATAGLRLVSEPARTAILTEVKNVLSDAGFNQPTARVITGQEEALFDWMSLNSDYLFNSTQQTISEGALDLGGASLEIAYEVTPSEKTHSEDYRTFLFKQIPHTVYAKSYLGLGQSALIAAANQNFNTITVCYPEGTWPNINNQRYLQQTCQNNLNMLLQNYNVTAAPTNQHFQAFSAFYYVDRFFDFAHLSKLKQTVQQSCQRTWQTIVANSQDQPQYLINYCIAGSYVDTLLRNHFKLDDARMTFNRDGVDWTKGAALYLTFSENK